MNVNWNIYDLSTQTKTWCCPFIDWVKVNNCLLCVNKDCRKKVTPHHSDERVVCNNPTYEFKIFVSWCKKAINAELLLTDKEDYKNQITITLFGPTLVNIVDLNKEKRKTEDDLLPLKDCYITYNKRIIVTSIFNPGNA